VSVKRLRVAVKRVGFALLIGVLLMTAEGETGILDASWTAPTTNTDGGPLTDLASFRLYYGTTASPCPGASFLRIESPTSTPASGQTMSARLTGLITGSRYFASVSAVDTTGNESACSTTADAVARDDFGGAMPSSAVPSSAMPSSVMPSSAILSSAPASVPPGGSVTVTWGGIAAPTPTDWIGFFAEGAIGGAYTWNYVSCYQGWESAKASGSCEFQVPQSQPPGRYEFHLYSANTLTRLATSSPFTVTPSSSTMLSTAPASAPAGASVVVTWGGLASPMPTDWIGLYAEGAIGGAYTWNYVSCYQGWESAKASGSCEVQIPQGLPPGRYEFHLYSANTLTRLATSNPLIVTP